MAIPDRFSADLAALSQALDDPGADIEASLQRLAVDLRRAVHSYLGLTLRTPIDGGDDLVITALEEGDEAPSIGASLSVRLPPLGADPGDEDVVTLILYAASPGAFVDIGADIDWLTGLPGVVLDDHLDETVESSARGVVTDSSTINQAIGVLLSRGLTVEEARTDLDTWAADGAATGRVGAAALVLRGLGNAALPPRTDR